MRAGDLRHRLKIQQRTVGKDSFGQELTTWTTFAEVWAQISPASGSEIFAASQIKAEISHSIRMRWRPELALPTKTMQYRLLYSTKYGDRFFNITASLNQDERNREILIYAVEGLTNE